MSAGKYITLSLKVPTRPPTLLHILENSLLEGVVDYKPIAAGIDPRTVRSHEVASAYQLKGDVSVIEDELQVQFIAKNIGLHVARIFANTKEVCRPVSFCVTPSGEVQGMDAPPTKQGLNKVDVRRSKYPSAQSAATTVVNSAASTVRAVESEHRLSSGSPPHVSFDGQQPPPAASSFFNKLLYKKETEGDNSYGRGVSRPVSTALTAEMFRSLSNNARVKQSSRFGHKVKTRCDICLRKTKLSKSITLLGNTFCDSCFTNLFLLRSAIDHFTPPTVKESIIQVPMNKRRTKFTSVTKELPDVNLKGLSPSIVRMAQTEFKKFDIDGDGWLDKVILLPLIKACLSSTISEPTVRQLLSGKPLQSMMESMELEGRSSVHEIEFISLMAFITRESQRIFQDMHMSSRFTHHDLAMAYAYKRQQVQSHVMSPSTDPLSQSHGRPAKVSKDIDLLEGVRKSFTDSPLSHYNPTGTEGVSVSPSNFVSGDPNGIPMQKTEEDNVEAPTDDDNDHNEENGVDEVDATNDTQTLTPPQTPTKQKPSKGQKQEEMEELKLTGNTKADGWMLY